jgi:15-cis-phytoene synthase
MARAGGDLFVPHTTTRLRTLWTLWRASRAKTFRSTL